MFQDSHFQRKRLLLNMINHLGPVSRTALIEYTAYRPATVGAIVTELLEQDLIVETGFHSNGQGRKRALLEINKEHICAIGIYFSANHITYVLSQFDGTVIEQNRTRFSLDTPKKDLVFEVADYVKKLLELYGNKKFVGIGICRPLIDPMSYKGSKAEKTQNELFAGWIHDDLTPALQKVTPLPVSVFSGVTLPAQAEYTFGVAKGIDNFIWVELSNGIGSSVFCNGDAIGGANGFAGELGHTGVDVGDNEHKFCYCGKPDCVEALASWPAIKENIINELRRGVISTLNETLDDPDDLTVEMVKEALDSGDRMCRYYVKKAAKKIGAAIANAVTLLNPEMIVLYGFMLELGDYFYENLEKAIRENTVFLAQDFEIKISTVSESIMPLGAAANMFFSYLRCDDYKWVYRLDSAAVDNISEAPFIY